MAKITMQSIYEMYKQDVYSYLMSLTHDSPLSEDLTSEVFLGAMKSLANFKGESSIKTWLFAIARNKWYEYLRKKNKEVDPEQLMAIYLAEDRSPEAMVMTQELIGRIHELLNQESVKNKEIVLMRVHGYSYYEIGKQQQLSESSARVIDFRTKNKIRTILIKEGYSQ